MGQQKDNTENTIDYIFDSQILIESLRKGIIPEEYKERIYTIPMFDKKIYHDKITSEVYSFTFSSRGFIVEDFVTCDGNEYSRIVDAEDNTVRSYGINNNIVNEQMFTHYRTKRTMPEDLVKKR